MCFYREGLLAPHPTPKLDDHPWSAVRGCLFNLFTATLHIGGRRVEEFKYLGTTLTDQNSIQEEIKSRLKLGNACYHSVQNLLSSRLLSKNLKIKIYIEL
jgi:hypothetical protein